MAKTNKHIIMQLRRKISSMAEEIMELRTELSKEEEKVFVLEQKLVEKMNTLVCLNCKHKVSWLQTLQGGGKRV